jgi:hypothetical protein
VRSERTLGAVFGSIYFREGAGIEILVNCVDSGCNLSLHSGREHTWIGANRVDFRGELTIVAATGRRRSEKDNDSST